jgi:hypothetical protein
MIEDNKIIIAVFLDFKRAFETIDRELLLRKMEQYGIKGAEFSWFRSCLSNRSQETMRKSLMQSIFSWVMGVPQGSVLGPLLFTLYINGIKNVLRYSKLNLFADDILLYIVVDTLDEAK